ncbi:MAG: hypothetical protein WD851_07455 [Pirellulales bacterium]
MNTTPKTILRQRAEYTHKFNLKTGRHGWLRLTPAYSVRIVEELIMSCDRQMRILDPFCGTATTALCAAHHGHHGVTTEINPFLVWFGRAKTSHYSIGQIESTREAGNAALDLVARTDVSPVAIPEIHNIQRWWSTEALTFLCSLRAAIDVTAKRETAPHTLLLVAFCRSLIAISNAAFNHQSMSFKKDSQKRLDFAFDFSSQFRDDLDFILHGAQVNPTGTTEVLQADARNLSEVLDSPVNQVITSPPYANRMSYIRELRPYMYWLGYLQNGRDAGELDWTAIGGTWGVATSRLVDWIPNDEMAISKALASVLDSIADRSNANGRLLATYVRKYFHDIYEHLASLPDVLTPSARVHYIVGNSTFYGVLVPVEQFYAESLKRLGFSDVAIRAVRKRNSKKELVEFDVSATWR